MKEIEKVKDDWGQDIIYVSKCDEYIVENPDTPKFMLTDL